MRIIPIILLSIIFLSCSKQPSPCNNIPSDKYQVIAIDTARMAVGPYSDTINVPFLTLRDSYCMTVKEAKIIEWETIKVGDYLKK